MSMCSVIRLSAAAAAVFMSAAAVAQRAVGIAEVAPPDAFLVVGVGNWTRSAEALRGSEMGKLWNEPQVQEFVKRASEEPMGQWAGWLEQINAKAEDFTPPTGAAGLALFMPANGEAQGDAGGDDEPPHVLAMADFGGGADDWADLLDKLIEQGESDGAIERREENYAGVDVIALKPVKGGQPGDEEFEPSQRMLGELMPQGRELFLAQVGGVWAACTDQAALEGAIDVLQMKDRPSHADTPAYTRSLAQHPREVDALVTLVTAPLGPMLKHAMGPPGMMLGLEDATPIFEALGLTDFEAFSVGVRLDAGNGMPEQTMGVLMPRKQGLVALVADAGGTPLDAPAFIGPDAASVSRIRFKFDGLIGTLRAVLNATPEETRAQAGGMFEEFAQLMGPAFAQLGPDVYILQSYTKPLAASSDVMTVALQVRDPLVIGNTITFLTAQGGGLFTPRDFQGNTIHESAEAGIAIGQGFGHVFIGPTAGVENAMRGAGSPDAPKLADEPAFQEGVRALGRDAIGAAYTDMAQAVEWMYWQFQNMDKVREEVLGGFEGWSPEEREEHLKLFRDAQPDWMKDLPPMEVIRPYLGVSVGEVWATPEGFQGRSIMLRRR